MHVQFTLQQITQQLGGTVSDGIETLINRVGSLALAQAGAISFFNDTKYTVQLSSSAASAVIIRPEHASLTSLPKIITDNPYAYFAMFRNYSTQLMSRQTVCTQALLLMRQALFPQAVVLLLKP